MEKKKLKNWKKILLGCITVLGLIGTGFCFSEILGIYALVIASSLTTVGAIVLVVKDTIKNISVEEEVGDYENSELLLEKSHLHLVKSEYVTLKKKCSYEYKNDNNLVSDNKPKLEIVTNGYSKKRKK